MVKMNIIYKVSCDLKRLLILLGICPSNAYTIVGLWARPIIISSCYATHFYTYHFLLDCASLATQLSLECISGYMDVTEMIVTVFRSRGEGGGLGGFSLPTSMTTMPIQYQCGNNPSRFRASYQVECPDNN